jgi:hypothetical protein
VLPIALFVFFVQHDRHVAVPPHIGYGFNVAYPDSPRVAAIGFDWIKTFDDPPCPNRLPVKVLVRIDVDGHTDLNAWRNSVRALAQSRLGCVDAFEIGNEPNLDTNYGWAVAPNAGDYTAALCAAYEEIKNASRQHPISAGLAPTGASSEPGTFHPATTAPIKTSVSF